MCLKIAYINIWYDPYNIFQLKSTSSYMHTQHIIILLVVLLSHQCIILKLTKLATLGRNSTKSRKFKHVATVRGVKVKIGANGVFSLTNQKSHDERSQEKKLRVEKKLKLSR